ncbi:hypothetical protein FSP39_007893 [Pinctada imbricata]|uniref:Uncharacterized protein n=1 Tax=Pinctada imbricata TaxID=66713 RepID=A0AA88YUK8_PINIB|nr:hypothetical protein FSP39_007893 [Pinctada imbricata]
MKILVSQLRKLVPGVSRYCTFCHCHRADQLFSGQMDSVLHRRTYSVCKKWGLHPLKSRGLVRLKGNDVVPFLQGLITNDVTKLGDSCRSLYSMMLNVQGRVLYDMMVYQTPGTDNTPCVLVEVDREVVTEFIKTMKKYKIRKKVDITDVTGELQSYAVTPQDSYDNIPWLPINQESVIAAEADPRLQTFGWRVISPDQSYITSNVDPDVTVSLLDEHEYHIARYKLGIPEGIKDLPPGDCLPLESNLVFHDGVSFTKGCYIGQELTARTHHTGVTRKRLMPIVLDRIPKDVTSGSNIVTSSGRSAGKFRNAADVYGLGLIRLAHLKEKLEIRVNEGDKYCVETAVPSWWPQEAEASRL